MLFLTKLKRKASLFTIKYQIKGVIYLFLFFLHFFHFFLAEEYQTKGLFIFECESCTAQANVYSMWKEILRNIILSHDAFQTGTEFHNPRCT